MENDRTRYLPLCLKYNGKGEGCERCCILATGRCEQFTRTLGWIFYKDLLKHGSISPVERLSISNDIFGKVVERISREKERPITHFSGLVRKIYKGVLSEFYTGRIKGGLTGFGERRPGDLGISILPPELPQDGKGNESDRSNFDVEAIRRHEEEKTREGKLDSFDAAIDFLEKVATKRSKSCVRVYLCLKKVILAGGDQQDCAEPLGYKKPNSLTKKIQNCRKLLEGMPI